MPAAPVDFRCPHLKCLAFSLQLKLIEGFNISKLRGFNQSNVL